jgi:hypothetical protein
MKSWLRRMFIAAAPLVWSKVSPVIRRKFEERRRKEERPEVKQRGQGWRRR